MQFHLNGFRAGDPSIAPEAAGVYRPADLPETADVLIVGCGPAGLTLAAQLAQFPKIRTVIVDQKDGPLSVGQADGIACRTMEMFEAFGFADRVLAEAYWVNETAFWTPAGSRMGEIVRSGRIQDTEDGLSEFPHVILNQARVHDFYLDVMRRSPSRLEPFYGRRFVGLTRVEQAEDYPLEIRLERNTAGGPTYGETLRARYVVGCDGAHSQVRRALGLQLRGDSAHQVWGVMDVLAVTDFPDIRLKSIIRSADQGSMLIIPREGGYLVRLYIELDKLAEHERVAARSITQERLIAAAQRILSPYELQVKEVAWWSVYEIAQRHADRFDDGLQEDRRAREPKVFLAGDACHTHSPKAGQGMNVSMQDAFNLGWKLASVIEGRSCPALLKSYSDERLAVASDLIAFDRKFASLLSARSADSVAVPGSDDTDFQKYFIRQGRYTAGTETHYAPSLLTGDGRHQALAKGLRIGMRLHSAPVVRLADAKPMQLGHVHKADGRWRIYVFDRKADSAQVSTSLRELCRWLGSDPASPMRHCVQKGRDIDTLIDIRAILRQPHRDVSLSALPSILLPGKGRYGLIDYEKTFCPDFADGRNIFELREIADEGCVVVVRPDQYISNIFPIDEPHALGRWLERFTTFASMS